MEQNEFDDALAETVGDPERVSNHEQPAEEPAPEPDISVGYEPGSEPTETPTVQYVAPAPVPDPDTLSEAIVEAPQDVAIWAIQAQQPHIYESALEEWRDQDAEAASQFERALDREVVRQQYEHDPAVVAARERQAAEAVVSSFNSLSEKYSDFSDVLSNASEEQLAGIDMNALRHLQATNPASALELIYRWVSSSPARSSQRPRSMAAQGSGSFYNSSAKGSVMERLASSMLDPNSVQAQLREMHRRDG
jgi:hypothetical protein